MNQAIHSVDLLSLVHGSRPSRFRRNNGYF